MDFKYTQSSSIPPYKENKARSFQSEGSRYNSFLQLFEKVINDLLTSKGYYNIEDVKEKLKPRINEEENKILKKWEENYIEYHIMEKRNIPSIIRRMYDIEDKS